MPEETKQPITRAERLLARIRREAKRSGMAQTHIAAVTGLHVNSVRKLFLPKWNPSIETVRSLELALLPPDQRGKRE